MIAEIDSGFIIVGGKPGNRPSEVFKSPEEPLETLTDFNDFPHSTTNILGYNLDGKYHVIGQTENQLFTYSGSSWIPEGLFLWRPRSHAAISKYFGHTVI